MIMNAFLYLILDVATISIPLIYSVLENEFNFSKHFKNSIASILFVSIPFILWDVIFTQNKIWGFNQTYLVGVEILSLPIEEWLFFICIPFACLFTHQALKHYANHVQLPIKITKNITFILILVALIILVYHFGKWYSTVNLFIFIVLLGVALLFKKIKVLQTFYIAFLIIIAPFLIVNGILTGTFTEHPVVWYNEFHFSNVRILTIPLEDFFYAFSMLFSIELVFDYLKNL